MFPAWCGGRGAGLSMRIVVQRVFFGVLAIAVLVTLFQIDLVVALGSRERSGMMADLLSRGSVVPLLILVVLLRGAVEMHRGLRARGIRPHFRFACLMIAAVALAPWLSPAGWLGAGVADKEGLYWPLVLLAVTVLGTGVLTVLRGDPGGSIADAGATLLMVFYLGLLSSFGLQLRSGVDTPAQEGVGLLLITLLVTKASDIGAYFTGSALGRHKLIPRVSPGKSVEGAIGGLVGSAGAGMLLAWGGLRCGPGDEAAATAVPFFRELVHAFSAMPETGGMHPIARAAVFGLCLSAAGQFGDLFESCFKRDAGVKDSGHVMPQYGGVLDLIDSPVFALPTAWFLLTWVWNLV